MLGPFPFFTNIQKRCLITSYALTVTKEIVCGGKGEKGNVAIMNT